MAFDDETDEREYTHVDLSVQITELREYLGNRLDSLCEVERACTDEVNDQRERCRVTYARAALLGAIKQTALVLVVCSTVYACAQVLANAFGHH